MSSTLLIYFSGIAEQLQKTFAILSAIFLVSSFVLFICSIAEDCLENLRNHAIFAVCLAVFCFLTVSFIPDRKTIVAMAVIPATIDFQNKGLQKYPEDVVEFIREYISSENHE